MNAPEKVGLNVYQRLNAARKEFHSLKLKKTGHNKFAGYYYFELGDFLIPALDVFERNGLCATVSFDRELASMTIRCEERPEDSLTITSPFSSAALKGCHEVQNVGAVETYQRRYLWVAALEIVEHDAIDSSKPLDEAKASKISPVAAVVESDAEIQAILNDPEEADYLRSVANELIQLVENENKPEEARKHLAGIQLNNAKKMALWSILAPNSKTRAAIKKKQEVSLAEQA